MLIRLVGNISGRMIQLCGDKITLPFHPKELKYYWPYDSAL